MKGGEVFQGILYCIDQHLPFYEQKDSGKPRNHVLFTMANKVHRIGRPVVVVV